MTNDRLVFVSVIIPVFNDTDGLISTLLALDRQSHPRDAFEVIVVENGPKTIPPETIAGYPNARLVHEPVLGSYAARNKGITLARGEVIAFTDANCLPERHWIENAANAFQRDEDCKVLCGRIDVFPKIPGAFNAFEHYDRLFGFQQRHWVTHFGYGAGANLIIRRSALETVGIFNARLKSMGDAEWCGRAIKQGLKICYADDTIIKHPARGTFRQLYNKTLRTAGGLHDAAPSQKKAFHAKRIFTRLLTPNLHSIRLIFSDQDIPGLVTRLHVLLIGIFLRLGRITENVRLARGRQSQNT